MPIEDITLPESEVESTASEPPPPAALRGYGPAVAAALSSLIAAGRWPASPPRPTEAYRLIVDQLVAHGHADLPKRDAVRYWLKRLGR
jgi:hypothetical protein